MQPCDPSINIYMPPNTINLHTVLTMCSGSWDKNVHN